MEREKPKDAKPKDGKAFALQMLRSYGLMVIIAVLAVKSCDWWPGKAWNDAPETAQRAQDAPPPATPGSAESVTAAFAQREARGKAVSQLAKFKEVYNTTKAELAALETAMKAWQIASKDVLQNDEGRRIAANANAVTEAKALFDMPRADRETLERLRSSADVLFAPVAEALATPESIWSPEKSLPELNDLLSEARKANAEYRGALAALESLARRTADETPSRKTLADAFKQVLAEHLQAHAMELKKIAVATQAASEQREIDQKKALERRGAMARDPKALKLLDFTGLNRPGDSTAGVWMACWAADAYSSPGQFYDYALAGLRPQFNERHFDHNWQVGEAMQAELKSREQIAQAQFGMSLYELFKVVAVSEANQKRFASDDEMRQVIESAQAKGNTKDAADWAAILAKGKKLPKPEYP